MQAIGTETLLQVWEQGRSRPTAERALALLALALPGQDATGLASISLGRRDRILFDLRRRLFGATLSACLHCPACGECLGISLDLPETGTAETGEGAFADRDGLRFRAPDSADLAALADADDADDAVQRLLHRCCLAAPAARPQIWDAERIAEIEAGLERLDGSGELCLDLRCDHCGHGWQTSLDPAPFLWAELDARARRLLHDVHCLARAYGWPEREILAMSPARRGAYLELIG